MTATCNIAISRNQRGSLGTPSRAPEVKAYGAYSRHKGNDKEGGGCNIGPKKLRESKCHGSIHFT